MCFSWNKEMTETFRPSKHQLDVPSQACAACVLMLSADETEQGSTESAQEMPCHTPVEHPVVEVT